MPTNLGRVRGSFIYNGNAITDSAIKSELSAAGALVLDKDIYICNSSGNHPYFIYNASRDVWENKGTISGIDNFDSFLSLSSTNGVQNKIITAFAKDKCAMGSFKVRSSSNKTISLLSIIQQLIKVKQAPSGSSWSITKASGLLYIDACKINNLESSWLQDQLVLWRQESGRYNPGTPVSFGPTCRALIVRFDWWQSYGGGSGQEYFTINGIAFTGSSISLVSGSARISTTSPSVGTYGGDMYISFNNDVTSHVDDYVLDAVVFSAESVSS